MQCMSFLLSNGSGWGAVWPEHQNLCPMGWNPQDEPNELCMGNPTTPRKTHIQKSINETIQVT